MSFKDYVPGFLRNRFRAQVVPVVTFKDSTLERLDIRDFNMRHYDFRGTTVEGRVDLRGKFVTDKFLRGFRCKELLVDSSTEVHNVYGDLLPVIAVAVQKGNYYEFGTEPNPYLPTRAPS